METERSRELETLTPAPAPRAPISRRLSAGMLVWSSVTKPPYMGVKIEKYLKLKIPAVLAELDATGMLHHGDFK